MRIATIVPLGDALAAPVPARLLSSAALVLLLAGCSAPVDPPLPWIGAQRTLVVPAAWPDAPPTVDLAGIEAAFFDADDSLAAWIAENSAGAASIDGDVLPWVTLGGAWADLSDCQPDAVLAATWAAIEDEVDPTDYDADGDGLIDHLVVLHAGRTADDRISHRCMFGDLDVADRAIALQSQGLGSVGEEVPVGLYAHEAGHSYFGLRDQYGSHYHGDYGVGVWGAMGLGQWGPNNQVPRAALWRRASHLAAPHKVRIGWATARRLDADVDDLRIDPIESGGDVVQIPDADGDLWLEVRSPRGFSADGPGHGLLVWRTLPDRYLELIQADGRDDLRHGTDLGARPLPPIDENFGDDSDPFPGSLGITELNVGARLSNIRHDGDSILLSIRPRSGD